MATLHGLVTENIGRYGSELAVVYDDTKSWTMMSYHDLGCQMKMVSNKKIISMEKKLRELRV